MQELAFLRENLKKETDFICNLLDYITTYVETSDVCVISAAEQLILKFNRQILEEKRRKLVDLKRITTIKEEPQKGKIKKDKIPNESCVQKELCYRKERKDYTSIIIKMLQDGKATPSTLNALSDQEIKECKLAIFEEILKLEEEIKEWIIEDASKSIQPLQEKLILLKNLQKRIKEEAKPKEEKNIFNEVTTKSKKKVLFLPNGKGSTYFVEDITRHLEKNEELKTAFTKIASGYFLESKDNEKIKDVKEKLYEYTSPNGIRILYIDMGESTYAICGLFFKNKQKSTKITEYFEEAIRRFYNKKEYLKENLNNPNLYIEQAELIGEIYTILENKAPTLKEVL